MMMNPLVYTSMRCISVRKGPRGEDIYPAKTLSNKNKEYVVDPLKGIRDPLSVDKPFEPKKEYT